MLVDNNTLLLSTNDHFHFLRIDEIVYCKSENTYTTFHLVNDTAITVSVPIKKVEELLKNHNFIRSHQSYLVNIFHIRHIAKQEGKEITLQNNSKLPVSSRKRKALIHFLCQKTRIQIMH